MHVSQDFALAKKCVEKFYNDCLSKCMKVMKENVQYMSFEKHISIDILCICAVKVRFST